MPITDNLAVDFANTNRQEQQWLRDELNETYALIKAIAIENNNVITISKRSLSLARNFKFKNSYEEGLLTVITVEEKCQY